MRLERSPIPRRFRERGEKPRQQTEQHDENPHVRLLIDQTANQADDQTKLRAAHERAEILANDESDELKIEEPITPKQPELSPWKKFKRFLRIPESISFAIEEAEKSGDFQAVDQFNEDVKKTPRIIRKPKNRLAGSLIASAIGAVAATHEPQIEKAVERGMEIMDQKFVKPMTQLKNDALAFFERTHFFGKGEAFATTQEWQNLSPQEQADFKKVSKLMKNFPKEYASQAARLMEAVEYNRADYATFFLTMEMIHGQITQEQFDQAMKQLGEQAQAVHDRLTKEERMDPIHVAFELAKQRTKYVREKADVYSLTTKGEGNCESLVRYLLSQVPRVTHDNKFHPMMAIQLFTDHVRFLVRMQSSDPWQWIDGHEHGTLTLEEMKGTLIVDPQTMMLQALHLQDRAKKDTVKLPPEASLGYKTNSMLTWETNDSRKPMRAAGDGNTPEQMDETKAAKRSFTKKEEKRETLHFVEVQSEIFEPSQAAPESEAKKEPILVAPTDAEVAIHLRRGVASGAYNDLRALEGISIIHLGIENPRTKYENASNIIDLAPLASSQLQTLEIEVEMDIRGFEKLDLHQLKTVYLGADANKDLVQKILHESKDLESFGMDMDEQIPPSAYVAMHLMPLDHFFSKHPVKAIIEKFKKQKHGIFRVYVHSPYEMNEYRELIFDAAKTTQDHPEDYLTVDVRDSLNANKKEPSILCVPNTVISLDYLKNEGVNLSKLQKIELHEESGWDEALKLRLHIDLTVLEQARNLDVIVISVPQSVQEVDLSVLNKLHASKIIIKIESKHSPLVIGLTKGQIVETVHLPGAIETEEIYGGNSDH